VYKEQDVLNRIAIEFVRDILLQNPDAKSFGAIYDAMSRAACSRSFRNLGHEELARTGISFSLLHTSRLESLIAEVQKSIVNEGEENNFH